jgi:hypothetical protein
MGSRLMGLAYKFDMDILISTIWAGKPCVLFLCIFFKIRLELKAHYQIIRPISLN